MKPAEKAFQEAVTAAEHIELRPGLQVVKKGEGKGQLVAADPRKLLGGADIDEDCRAAYPNDNRWDYLIGYERGEKAVAYFVEVHSAETSDVSKMSDKLRWLQEFLEKEPQERLRKLPREIHWVASGRVNIPRHLPQFKLLSTTLRKAGLRGPVTKLTLA